MPFSPEKYGSLVSNLLDMDRICELGPGSPNREVYQTLTELGVDSLFNVEETVDRDLGRCCLAGLWLRNDYLDESHTISQAIPSPEGSYWHGLMHRREPDFSNSKYWFRKAGDHAIFEELRSEACALAAESPEDAAAEFLTSQSAWDPFAFVDLCAGVIRSGTATEKLCRQIAEIEWQLLFDYCFSRAARGRH